MKRRWTTAAAALTALALVLAAVLAVLGGAWPTRETLRWARELRLSDVERIELEILPSSRQEHRRQLDKSACADAVSLINTSRGRYLPRPEEGCGGVVSLYLTLADGSVHRVSNIGNRYLVIDGDAYAAGYRWLSSWEELGLQDRTVS